MEFDVEQLTRFETAHIAGGEYLGLNTDSEITLQHEVTLGAGTQTELWLQENRKTINDVKVDHQEITGVWRSVKIESKQSTTTKNAVNVFQTFYKGWIEDLVSGSTINWDEARLLKSNHWHEAETKGVYPVTEANNPQQYHLIEWQGIDPEKINGIAAEIRALTPTAITPVINGEALGSGFYILDTLTDIEQNRQEGDKSGVITMLIGKTRVNLQAWENYGTPAQAKIYYLYDVPIYIAQTLINIYNKREGATASASQPNEKSLVAIIIRDKVDFDFEYDNITEQSCAYFVKTSYYYGIATPLDVPAHSMGTIYRGRFDIQKETGLYSGYIEERVRQTQHVVPYRSENTHGHYTDNERWTGVYLIDGLPEAATLSVVSGNIVKTMSTITLPDNTIPLGFTWSVSKQANDDCTIDIVKETITPEDQIETDTVDDKFTHRTVVKHTQNDAVPTSSFVPGTIVGVQAQPTPFGLHATAAETREAQAVADTDKTTSVDYLFSQLSERDRNQLVPGDDIVELDGTVIKTSKWSMNEFETYDNDLSSVTPIARSSGWIDVISRWGTDKKIEFRNQELAWMTGTLIPVFDADYNNSLSFNMNAHGLYDGSASRTAYKGEGAFSLFRSTNTKTRINIEEKVFEWYEPASGKPEVSRLQKRQYALMRRSVIVQTYQNADNTYSDYLELTAVGGYTDVTLVGSPKITAVTNEIGAKGYLVEAWYTKGIGDWILAGDAFP